VGYRQTFIEDVRRQLAAETESHAIWRIRFYAACVSIFFGMVGLVAFLSMARGVVSWAATPGCLAMLAGGVLGLRVIREEGVKSSRRLGFWAAICTVVGFLEIFLVSVLS
jgi:hypothetical protein